MKQWFLDFSGCVTLAQVHSVLGRGLPFPPYYGGNLSALWDCMRDMAGEPCVIHIRGLQRYARRGQAEAAYVEKMVDIFHDVERESPEVRVILEE